jgi:TusA-related sulfurtransferase
MSEVEFVLLKGPLDLVREQPDRQLDTTGLICPYPALEVAKALPQLGEGELLEVTTDSEVSATKSIPLLLEKQGFSYVVFRRDALWFIRAAKR